MRQIILAINALLKFKAYTLITVSYTHLNPATPTEINKLLIFQ